MSDREKLEALISKWGYVHLLSEMSASEMRKTHGATGPQIELHHKLSDVLFSASHQAAVIERHFHRT